MTLTCRRCGTTFEAVRRDAKYCSGNCRKRASGDRNRVNCEDCGTRLSEGSGWAKRRHCQPCEAAFRTWRGEVKLSAIEGMWNDGWPWFDIAAVLGRNGDGCEAIGPEIHELRAQGRIGYRYAGWEARRAA